MKCPNYRVKWLLERLSDRYCLSNKTSIATVVPILTTVILSVGDSTDECILFVIEPDFLIISIDILGEN